MQLRQDKSTEEIQEVLSANDYSFLFECGYSKPSITLADIQELLRTVWLHHTVDRVYGEIQQLKDGIVNTLNFNHIIASNPQAARSLFVPSNFHLTASFMVE